MPEYIDDARNVEPIDSYEETDSGFASFAHAWCRVHMDEDHDWSDYYYDGRLIESAWVSKAEEMFKFAYGYAGYGAGVARANVAGSGEMIVFRLPGWFAKEELGQWESWWFGNFEVAKQDDDDEWAAFCVSDIEPLKDRDEESYFRNPVEEEWIPFSLIEMAFTVEDERTADHLICDRGMDSSEVRHKRGEKDEADIEIMYGTGTQYGRKFVTESPYEAKDDFQALDWDQFHANWNGDNWEFDVNALWPFVEEMTMQGWTVCINESVEKETMDDPTQEGTAPYIPVEVSRDE